MIFTKLRAIDILGIHGHPLARFRELTIGTSCSVQQTQDRQAGPHFLQ
jgi:hypothetical protein